MSDDGPMDNWKEIEDVSQDCSYENGWCSSTEVSACGYCWRCAEDAQDLHRQSEDDYEYDYEY